LKPDQQNEDGILCQVFSSLLNIGKIFVQRRLEFAAIIGKHAVVAADVLEPIGLGLTDGSELLLRAASCSEIGEEVGDCS